MIFSFKKRERHFGVFGVRTNLEMLRTPLGQFCITYLMIFDDLGQSLNATEQSTDLPVEWFSLVRWRGEVI